MCELKCFKHHVGPLLLLRTQLYTKYYRIQSRRAVHTVKVSSMD